MIKKVVIPIAGLGTRFLPATKVVPKEMLPILDRPLIDYALTEAQMAGIEDYIFITNKDNNFPELYLKKNLKLEASLKKRKKYDLLKKLNNLSIKKKNIHIIHQSRPLGLGHAISLAEDLINKEDFAVLLPDDVIFGSNCLKELINIHEKSKSSVLGVMKVEKQNVSKYGIIEPTKIKGRKIEIKSIIEKPDKNNAPSSFGVVGRYILKNSIFDYLKKIKKGAGGEIQLTDAISSSLIKQHTIAYQFKGYRYDCGSKIGFLEAQIACAFMDNRMKKTIKDIFKKISEQHTR